MPTQTSIAAFPYAVKTVALGTVLSFPQTIYNDYFFGTPFVPQVAIAAEISMICYPPLFVYKTKKLFIHVKYTFDVGIATGDQMITRIYVRDTPFGGKFNKPKSEKFMDVNLVADVNRTIEFSMDLSSLISGQTNNYVALRFPVNVGSQARGNTRDTIGIWKQDLIYQTIGVRDEK